MERRQTLARIRTIKPEFWVDDVMVELSFQTRLFFIGLWNFADDEGFIEDKPKRLKMQIFPAESEPVDDSLSALVEGGRLLEYVSDEGPLLKVANWEHHQKINRPTPTRFSGIVPQNRRGSVSAPEYVSEHSPLEGKGRERKGKEGRGRGFSESPPTPTCKKHSNWDHGDPCGACMRDRQAAEQHQADQAKAAASARREAQRNPACPHGFPRHEKCERCGDSWPG